MNTLLDTIGPAVFRASWQAAALALVIVILVWCLGERLTPRWRYLLWSVVLVRLLLVVTPASPWSIFNFAPGMPPASAWQTAGAESGMTRAPGPDAFQQAVRPMGQWRETDLDEPLVATSSPAATVRETGVAAVAPPAASAAVDAVPPASSRESRGLLVARIVSLLWLAGCFVFGLKLLGAARVLQRRLAACRPVTDAAVLELLETARLRIGLRRAPTLLVTPESVSPCVAGAWAPRIVLPESVITDSSVARLRHLLAHELAHLVRGDLWTNWLLLTARILHWCNPVVWWTIREMQAERESACDEMALAALGEGDRSAYAATIVDLATNLAPSAIAPGMIGLFSSTRRLKARVERLVRRPTVTTFRTPLAAGLLIAMALLGLTDATPGAKAQAPKPAVSTKKDEPRAKTHTVSGRCFNDFDPAPLAGISVRLYKIEGRLSPPVEIARTVADADGRYAFTGLEPPRLEGHLDRLYYGAFGFAEGRPIGISFFHFDDKKEVVELRMAREKSTLSGRVIDAAGRPVVGATVLPYFVHDRPVPSLLSATTDANGRFKLDNVGVNKWPGGKPVTTSFDVRHPDYPATRGEAAALPADVVVTLRAGCLVTGTVADDVAGQPAAGVVISARRVDEWGESFVATDATGKFRLVVPDGRYDFQADANERVCVAATDRECLAGEKVELPQFKLIGGGFISGQVVDTVTGKSVTVAESGEPITLGVYGPSQSAGRVIAATHLAAVDQTGRFMLRAVPGDNFPYFVNTRGVRMSWDTQQQPAIVVKAGETTVYNMLITPEVPPEEKLKAAQKLVAALSKKPSDRTAQIILEFRKLNHTVDECELWCTLMRELVAVGREAVPQLCAELDRTTENVTLRRLAFALRAIGDPRAVPALIRAIPRTLLPASSDYGLIVHDKSLADFMQTYDLKKGKGEYFDFGRPEREISGALHQLTRQVFPDSGLFGFSRSSDPRRQVLQRRILMRQAKLWQAWWEAHWRELTDDAAYQKVDLAIVDEPLPPAAKTLGPQARIADGEGMAGGILSPACINRGDR